MFLRLQDSVLNPAYGFGAAYDAEPTVFGARRPGFPLRKVSNPLVDRWTTFMRAQGIARVVCLLPARQLRHYDDLLGIYGTVFGAAHVLHAPIEDFQLADAPVLVGRVLPFLTATEHQRQQVVVHCAGGVGRTGHVLAAWLVYARGVSNDEAIESVRRSGRNANEVRNRSALDALLNACRAAGGGRR